MSSPNLELFPDGLFARKGAATPAGGQSKDQPDPNVVALDGATGSHPGPEEDREQDAKTEETKPEPRKGKAKRRKSAAEAVDSEPAASVLKFRLLDESSEDLAAILRCAEGRAAVPKEKAAETGDEAPETAPETPEEKESAKAEAVPLPPVTAPSRGIVRSVLVPVALLVLIVAAGLYAGWYLSDRSEEPAPDLSRTGEDEMPSRPDPASPTDGDAAAADPRAAGGEPGPQNALKARGDSEPEASVEPAPTAIKPTVDVVRIEDDGSALIAGAAGPFDELIVLHNGNPIGVARADSLGQWILLPEQPLGPGPHDFELVVKSVEGSVTMPAPEADESGGPAPPQSETPESEAPDGGASGGEAGAEPAPGARESRLPAPEADPGSIETPTAEGYPLPLQKPAPAPPAATGRNQVQFEFPYIVQFSSTPSAQGAAWEWERLQKAFPELLDEWEPAVQQATLSGVGTVYRLRTGSFEKLSEARGFCAAFRERRQDCLVVKLTKAETSEPRLADSTP